MKSGQALIKNVYGIHCRPSAVIIKACLNYPGEIRARAADGSEADIKNMLSLLGLGLQCGQTVTIEVEGPDEDAMCQKVIDLFETNFDFKR